ncbi:hypothetical protein BC829DRAFT_393535 [Chytridium lagenaria]|nr:hypothetical protein BC829DRAFT_393535 [Chytridium lagenaria]
MERLDEGEFLNDNLIEFFLKYFSHSLFSDKSDDFHIFSTFFIHQLMTETSKKDKSIAYDKVSRGTRDAKIFQKKFLLIPINESLHWYLTVVVDPGKLLDEATASECQLLIFDSLHLKHRWVPPIVLEYLKHESLDKLKTEISETVTLRATYPNIQQQKNHCDCGIFVLHYAHTLLRNPKGVVEASKGRARLDTPEFGTLSEIRSRRHSFRQILLMEIKGFADRLKG